YYRGQERICDTKKPNIITGESETSHIRSSVNLKKTEQLKKPSPHQRQHNFS
ncbi:hypothetical protein LOAG_07801, partial [Loa loa]